MSFQLRLTLPIEPLHDALSVAAIRAEMDFTDIAMDLGDVEVTLGDTDSHSRPPSQKTSSQRSPSRTSQAKPRASSRTRPQRSRPQRSVSQGSGLERTRPRRPPLEQRLDWLPDAIDELSRQLEDYFDQLTS